MTTATAGNMAHRLSEWIFGDLADSTRTALAWMLFSSCTHPARMAIIR